MNIASGEDYKIIRQTDDRLQTEYYVLWGILPDGNLIMMRTPLESIRESVTISNRFLTYVGIIAGHFERGDGCLCDETCHDAGVRAHGNIQTHDRAGF